MSVRCYWPGGVTEWTGQPDLHGSWQQSGHIQSHLTHSALTPGHRQCCPHVNSHLQGSIALDHCFRPLAGVLGAVEGFQRAVEVGKSWLHKAGPVMMWEIYIVIGSDEWQWNIYVYGNVNTTKQCNPFTSTESNKRNLDCRLQNTQLKSSTLWEKSFQALPTYSCQTQIPLSSLQTRFPHFDP